MIRHIAIVGASAAGVSAARTLRASGFDGSIAVIDADTHVPYQRPELSKRALGAAPIGPADVPLLTEAEAHDLRLDLLLGERVATLDAGERRLRLESGARFSSDAILLATGGVARTLPLPGTDLRGVHTLRKFDDAASLREDLAGAESVAVIGGGLIGAEVAAALVHSGRRVSWLDAAAKPLIHVLPNSIAEYLIKAHQAQGIELHTQASIRALVGRGGRVEHVEVASGARIPAQVVVIGVGMTPDDSLAKDAGLTLSDGVHVDEGQRTSAAGIFAAGDVAAVLDSRLNRRRRQEHWQAAEEQGANAARVMLGQHPTATSVPWFWSDQGAHHVEMAGARGSEAVLRNTSKGPVAFQLQFGRLVGVAAANEIQLVRIGKRLMQNQLTPPREVLADPSADLRRFLSVHAQMAPA